MFHNLVQSFIDFFVGFPPEVGTLLMAVFPIAERVALPVAMTVFKLPAAEAFFLVVLGNMVPVIGILALADSFHSWVSKNAGFFGKAWIKSIDHAQKKFAKYEKYGLIGLFVFLVIPTPFNGVFTAALIAFILGYPMQKSLPYLFAGVLVANAVTLALTVGAVKIF